MQRVVLSSLLLFSLASSVHAQGNWYMAGGAGATFPKANSGEYVSSGSGGWPNDHYINKNIDSAPELSFAGGYQWAHDKTWLPFYSLGLNYIYTFPTTLNGVVQQYSLPLFENYYYRYKIQSNTLLGTVKADLFRLCNFMPFLSAGAGVSWNSTTKYTEQAMSDVTPRVSPGFNSQTNAYFSYTLGAGFDYIVQKNIWLSLKYEYGNQGHAQTGYGANTPSLTGENYSGSRLKNTLSSNSVLLSGTYFFDSVN